MTPIILSFLVLTASFWCAMDLCQHQEPCFGASVACIVIGASAVLWGFWEAWNSENKERP